MEVPPKLEATDWKSKTLLTILFVSEVGCSKSTRSIVWFGWSTGDNVTAMLRWSVRGIEKWAITLYWRRIIETSLGRSRSVDARIGIKVTRSPIGRDGVTKPIVGANSSSHCSLLGGGKGSCHCSIIRLKNRGGSGCWSVDFLLVEHMKTKHI